jgi:hypothetical protein
VEGSLVYLGALPLTRMLSALTREGAEEEMDLEKIGAALETLAARLVALEQKPAPAAADKPTPESELAALAEDGKAYRAHLVADTERLALILAAEVEAKAALAGLEGKPLAQVIALRDSYQEKVDLQYPAGSSARIWDAATHASQQREAPKPGRRRGITL